MLYLLEIGDRRSLISAQDVSESGGEGDFSDRCSCGKKYAVSFVLLFTPSESALQVGSGEEG